MEEDLVQNMWEKFFDMYYTFHDNYIRSQTPIQFLREQKEAETFECRLYESVNFGIHREIFEDVGYMSRSKVKFNLLSDETWNLLAENDERYVIVRMIYV